MKNYTAILTIVVLVGAFGVFGYFKMNKPSNNIKMEQPTPTQTQQASGEIKEFIVTAKNWQFDPPEIKVKEGDRVRIRVKSLDVIHGFAIPQFNVNLKLDPNKEMIAEFTASKKGEFNFFCNIPCGDGHKDMRGKLIVE